MSRRKTPSPENLSPPTPEPPSTPESAPPASDSKPSAKDLTYWDRLQLNLEAVLAAPQQVQWRLTYRGKFHAVDVIIEARNEYAMARRVADAYLAQLIKKSAFPTKADFVKLEKVAVADESILVEADSDHTSGA